MDLLRSYFVVPTLERMTEESIVLARIETIKMTEF